MSIEKQYYSSKEASKLLGVKIRTLYRYAHVGIVPSKKDKLILLFPKKEIDMIKANKDSKRHVYNQNDVVFFDGLKAEFMNYVKDKYTSIGSPTSRALIYFEGEGLKFVDVTDLSVDENLKEAI